MNQRKLYDVSLTIYPGMPVWPGNPEVAVDSVKSISEGASSKVSLVHIGTHTATHVDAPQHFIEDAPGVDSIPAELLVGPARLVQLPEVRVIDRAVLEGLDLEGVTRLLLGTRNSVLMKQAHLSMDYAFVSADAASYMVELGIKVVGIDYLSIEEYRKEGRPTHHILLGAGVVIIEGLDLAGVPPGDYELLCLPLKLKDADGAPARVVLRELPGG
jgi:arylformamidase